MDDAAKLENQETSLHSYDEEVFCPLHCSCIVLYCNCIVIVVYCIVLYCIVLYCNCIVLQWSQFLLQDLLLFLQEVGPYTKEIFRKPPNARCCRQLGEKLNRSDFYWDVDESCNGLLLAAVLKVRLPFFFRNF